MDAPREKDEAPRESEEEPRTPLMLSAGATLVRKFGSILGGGRGDDSRRIGTPAKRGSILPSFSPRPSAEEPQEKDKDKEPAQKNGVPLPTAEEKESSEGGATITESQSQPVGSVHRRAATILDPQGRAMRHERRSSTGAALMTSMGGTIGRHRRPSTAQSYTPKPLGERLFGRTEEEEEETEQPEGEETRGQNGTGGGEALKDDEGQGEDKEFKPVYLKGLFR